MARLLSWCALVLVVGAAGQVDKCWSGGDEGVAARALAEGGLATLYDAPRAVGGGASGVETIEAANGTWFGLVHGVPMRLARLDAAVPLADLRAFLLSREPSWRALPENPAWDADGRRQVTSKYRYYNALREARTSANATARAAGLALDEALKANFVAFARTVGRVAGAPCAHADWPARLKVVDEELWGAGRGVARAGVSVQSWMNAHRDVDGERGLALHRHDFGIHAYLLLDAEPSLTAYHAPPPRAGARRPLFAFDNADGVLVVLCGGVDHGVLPTARPPDAPRLSMAFDFTWRMDHKGVALQHPGMAFGGAATGGRRLDSDGVENTWAAFMDADEVEARLDGHPKVAVDFAAIARAAKAPGGLPSRWAGAVDLAALLDGGGAAPPGGCPAA